MPRPSLKQVRSEEILASYAKCIVRFGLEGATQEKIAVEAGVQRSILRHYLGNREQMIGALIDYVDRNIESEVEALVGALPESGRVSALIDLLFDASHASDENTAMTMQALASASHSHPQVHSKILSWSGQFIDFVIDELFREFPDAADEDVFQTAFGIVALYFNIDSFAPIDIPGSWWVASGNAAHTLVSALESN